MQNKLNPNLREYGDLENHKKDVLALWDILSRQGNHFAIDVIAETVATAANKFKLSEQERENLRCELIHDLSLALQERL